MKPIIKKERKPWSQYPSRRPASTYADQIAVASTSAFKLEDAEVKHSRRRSSVEARRSSSSSAIKADSSLTTSSSRRPKEEVSRQRRSAKSEHHSDSDEESDDFVIEAAKETIAYLKERGKKIVKKKRKKPTAEEIARDTVKLCMLLDPDQAELTVDAARSLMRRSMELVQAQKKELKAETIMERGTHPADSDSESDDNEDDTADATSNVPPDDIKRATDVTLGNILGAMPPAPVKPEPTEPALPQPSTSRYKPLIVKSEDLNGDVASSDEEEEEDMLARRPRKQTAIKTEPTVKMELDENLSAEEEEVFSLSSTSQRTATSQRTQSQKPAEQSRHIKHSTSDDEDDEEAEMILSSARIVQRAGSKPDVSRPRQASHHIDVDMKPFFGFKPGQEHVGPLVLDDENGIQVPASINTHLRDYQRDGIRFLWSAYSQGRGGILGDDMGLGKTVQVIGFLAAIMMKTGGSRDQTRRIDEVRLGRAAKDAKANSTWPTCLIICPQTVIGNWQNEIGTWGYFEHAVYGSGYTGALKDFKRGRLDIVLASHEYARDHIDHLRDLPWSCIFADEAHKFKNPDSQMTINMNKFDCKVRFGLSGTVIQNRMEEMWTLLDWTNPGRFGMLLVWQQLVSEPIKLGQRKTASRRELADSQLIAKLLTKNLLSAYLLRRTKKLIADQLPRKFDKIVFCPLAPEQLQAYRKLMDQHLVVDMRLSRDPCECGRTDREGLPYRRGKCCHRIDSGEILRVIYLMSCLSNHAALFFPDPNDAYDSREEVRYRYEMQSEYTDNLWPNTDRILINNQENGFRTELCGKWTVLVRLMKSWHKEKDKVLLFSRNLRLLDWISYWVQLVGYNFLRLDGSTPQIQRQAKVDEFNRDPTCFIFLISTTAGGTGLNLTGANKVVVFDPHWNPAHDMQAMDRAYRFGQTRDVYVYRLVGAGTLEENIYARQIYKSQAANIGYTASKERRFFAGVEGRPDLEGELFGIKNMFTLREETCSITKEIIEDGDVDEAVREAEQFDSALATDADDKKHKKPKAKQRHESPEDEIIAASGIRYTHDHGKVMAMKSGGDRKGKRRHDRGDEDESGDDEEDEEEPKAKRPIKAKAAPSAVWPPPRRHTKSE